MRARPYSPLTIKHYTPVFKPFSPPAIETVFDAPLICVQFSEVLLPYILGALEVWRYVDAFTGTSEEKAAATQLFLELQYQLGNGECTVPISNVRLEDCVLQVQFEGSDEWVNVGNISECGAVGPQGPAGETGPAGEQGESGSAANAPAPIDTATGADKELQACAMAQGLANWLRDKCVSAIEIIQQAAILAKSIADQVTDLLDAIPIFGPLVNNLIDLANDMAAKGDYGDIIDHLRTVEFFEALVCRIYCNFLKYDTIGVAQIEETLTDVVSWAVVLPPGLPFLTLYGQAFALFLATVDDAVAWKRAFLHDDERSDDCQEGCEACEVEVHLTYLLGATGPASVLTGQEFDYVVSVFDGTAWNGGIEFDACCNLTLVSQTGATVTQADSEDCGHTYHNGFNLTNVTKIGTNSTIGAFTLHLRLDSVS